MQTMPDKTFTFTVPNDDGTPVYTATPQGDYWRVQWQDDGKFREVQYPHATAQRCVERGVWVIQVPGTRTVDSLPEAGGYKLGDKVRVTNKGQTHSCYERWAMAHDLKNWSNGKAPLNGHVLTVVEIGYFFDRDEVSPMLFGLQDEAGNTFIVNSNGFEAVAAKQDDAAFVAKTIELRVELAGINKQLEALTAPCENHPHTADGRITRNEMSKDVWQQAAVQLSDEGYSWRAIAEKLGKSKSTVSDYLRGVRELQYMAEGFDLDDEGVEDNSCVLVISDMHIPYHHPKLVPFLAGLKNKYKPTRVVCIGDELDKHAMSFHDSDPDLDSAGVELEKAQKVIKQLERLFPRMDIIDSNHGSMLYRKAKAHGIPRQYLKSYNDVLGVGQGWKWHYDLTINLPDGNPVYFHHGKSKNGLKLSQSMGMSCVQGHYHEDFNVSWWANPRGLYFSMQVGCLIDPDSYAFTYANVNIKRQIIGTGLILDSRPVLEPMPL